MSNVAEPLWNGDLSTGNLSQYGGWEYAGTFTHTPPLSERVTVAATIDGITPPPTLRNLMRVTVRPGDTYGKSTGWRTLARQYEPIRPIQAGHDSIYVWAQLVPPNYPGDANMWVAPIEVHQSKAPYVTGATGPAPAGIVATGSGFDVHVRGGRDLSGERVDYVRQTVANVYPRDKWLVFVMRYRHDVNPRGIFELLYAVPGEVPRALISKAGIGTMYEQTTNYVLIGAYRDQSGTAVTTYYLAGFREYAYADLGSALSYAAGIAGATTDKFAAARRYVERFRTASPNVAAAFDETFKALS